MKKQQQKQDRLSYTCTDGMVVKLRVASHTMYFAINATVEREFRERGRQVDVPKYTIILAGGGEETHDHDEKSIEDASTEEQEQWQDHLDTQAEIELEVQNRNGLFLFQEGLDDIYEKNAERDDWVKRYERWCGPVPEKADDRFITYIETQVIKTPNDQIEVMSLILGLMLDGVPEDLVGIAREMFRDSLAGYTTSVELQPAMGEVAGIVDDSEAAGDGEQANGGPDGA